MIFDEEYMTYRVIFYDIVRCHKDLDDVSGEGFVKTFSNLDRTLREIKAGRGHVPSYLSKTAAFWQVQNSPVWSTSTIDFTTNHQERTRCFK